MVFFDIATDTVRTSSYLRAMGRVLLIIVTDRDGRLLSRFFTKDVTTYISPGIFAELFPSQATSLLSCLSSCNCLVGQESDSRTPLAVLSIVTTRNSEL